MGIEIRQLTFSYGERKILNRIDLSVTSGEVIGVLGPNGVGKSTLFRCILGFLKRYSGEIFLDGENIRLMERKKIAKKIAYIPQSSTPAFNYSVLDTVLMGMSGRFGLIGRPTQRHVAFAMDVLDHLGIAHLSQRGCGEISGGERQLALLARAMVQEAKTIIMDEPTANLDYGNQNLVMESIDALANRGYTIILSSHDPNQVLLYATRALVLHDGRIIADGAPSLVLTEEVLSGMYGIEVARHDVRGDREESSLFMPVKKKK